MQSKPRRFWDTLKKPFFCLAPMADVTDPAFRMIIAKYSKVQVGTPFVFWTEFVSVDGLFWGGGEVLEKDLAYGEEEHPIVAQFFTSKPELMERAARLAAKRGFDGIDINMGCPDRSIEKQGAGAALIKNPTLAQEIIAAAQEGAGDMPVSVKTRIGYNKNEVNTWIPALLEAGIPVLTVHARTRKEMSKVPAHWDAVGDIVALRDELGSETLIVGNGDALDVDDANAKAEESGADGVMLGRAIFGNPWLFSSYTPTLEEKLRVLVEHTKLFEEKMPHKNFSIMKKHYKAYVTGFDGAKELRVQLMETHSAREVEDIIKKYLAE